jgi:hypothetical protein
VEELRDNQTQEYKFVGFGQDKFEDVREGVPGALL